MSKTNKLKAPRGVKSERAKVKETKLVLSKVNGNVLISYNSKFKGKRGHIKGQTFTYYPDFKWDNKTMECVRND